MKKNKLFLLLAILICFSTGKIYALDGVSISTGPAGAAGLTALRVGLEQSWHKQWFADKPWNVQGYWDLSFYAMRRSSRENVETNNKLAAVAITPVFRFYKTDPIWQNKDLYFELGVGVAQISKRTIGTRELGINFQFEDRAGVGVRFGKHKQYDLSYRAVHFSNAYLGRKNHGINLHLFSLNYWFI